MKKTDQFHAEVANLLQRSVTEEATSKVWKVFETALGRLDEESLSLFRDFMDGNTTQDLAEARDLKEADVKTWLDQIKRELAHHIRNGKPTKQ